MITRSIRFGFFICALLVIALAVVAPASAAGQKDHIKPTVSHPVRSDLSESLRIMVEREKQLRLLRPVDPSRIIPGEKEIENEELPREERARLRIETMLRGGIPVAAPQIRPTGPVVPLIPGPLTTFPGLNQVQNYNEYTFRFNPPDTNGDVGPNHYIQTVNNNFGVFTKAGAMILGPARISTLFIGFGGDCEFNDSGDPVVLYDPIADRWLITQFTATTPNFQCIAVSQTSDPTGAYYRYAFLQPNPKFGDYPKYGVWPDAYYLTTNQFAPGFVGGGAYAFNRLKMIAGDPTAEMIYFDLQFFDDATFGCTGTIGCPGGMLPADLDGIALPPAGAPGIFAMFTADEDGADPPNNLDALRIFEFHADFATPANSTFTERAESPLPVAAFDYVSPSGRADIPQFGTVNRVDSITDRLMHRLAYRKFGSHESLDGRCLRRSLSGCFPGWRSLLRNSQNGRDVFHLRTRHLQRLARRCKTPLDGQRGHGCLGQPGCRLQPFQHHGLPVDPVCRKIGRRPCRQPGARRSDSFCGHDLPGFCRKSGVPGEVGRLQRDER
jgi:hypothetical protein